jgi:hypothetical protein
MTAPTRIDTARVVHPPRGGKLTCKNWLIEAAYRMIQHNLDPGVAENPAELVVYGGIGRAARNWECFDAILKSLRELNPDETLLVQSGKPVGVFKTHADAPRVLIANSNLVPHWATWERLAGHRAGHLRNLRRDGAAKLRRKPQRAMDSHRRSWWDGRRPAARGVARRRLFAEHRMPAVAHRFSLENQVCGRTS